MRSTKLVLFLSVFPFASVFGAPVPCTSTTLADYINLTEGCTVDHLLFSSFGYLTDTATSNPTTADIMIFPAPSLGPNDWTGIRIEHISGQFLLDSPELNMDFEITFTVTAPPGSAIYAASLASDANATGQGNDARVREFVDYGSGQAQMQTTQGQQGPHERYFPFSSSVDVTKMFNLDTGGNEDSLSSLGYVDQGFASIPEPGTILLAMGGLGAIALRRMRR